MNFGPLNRAGRRAPAQRRRHARAPAARASSRRCAPRADRRLAHAAVGASGTCTTSSTTPSGARGRSPRRWRSTRGGSCESPFEAEVKRALEAKGHAVASQVGCSGYRIDLGVVDPDAPGRYLLGVECDGANYHGAKTARDRDRLRASVLGTSAGRSTGSGRRTGGWTRRTRSSASSRRSRRRRRVPRARIVRGRRTRRRYPPLRVPWRPGPRRSRPGPASSPAASASRTRPLVPTMPVSDAGPRRRDEAPRRDALSAAAARRVARHEG